MEIALNISTEASLSDLACLYTPHKEENKEPVHSVAERDKTEAKRTGQIRRRTGGMAGLPSPFLDDIKMEWMGGKRERPTASYQS